ncbi:iron uptake system protein EfeO [Gryllotalpicola protaetiae]|uniref:Peptidase M75 family protein n=1 Tax=Gryllotalpicola protaetiae TaxID=2419771 RepID=A0A387BF64_9MICO|nr:iron uptake system protein EfeO [Gryllotalpicola protaetiae]AYG02553.1 peptidase M75 family protein [Gryllotalpicola protaetiae]
MQLSNPARRLATAAGLAAVVAIALTACAPGGKTASGDDASPAASVAPVSNGASQIKVNLTGDSGDRCTLDHSSAKAGPITFTIDNTSSTAITEVELLQGQRIVGEKENLAPGLAPVKLTLTLGGGSYTVYCPGADTEEQKFTVTGKAAAQPTGSVQTVLAEGTKGYGTYVAGVLADMVTAVGNLNTAVQAGNLDEAKKDYALARPFYEKVESDVDGFVLPGFDATDNAGNLDYLIDMRESNLDPAVGWHGFHAVERDLWQNGAITDQTKQYASELNTNVGKLADLAKGLTYKPEDLANGAAGLLEEVQTNKISGEEESYSHIDLVDFAANVEGAEQAFAYLEPGLKKIDPDLTSTVQTQFDKVTTQLDTYRDPSVPGGYVDYTAQLKQTDASKLSLTVQALQEPLSKIAEKVATAG